MKKIVISLCILSSFGFTGCFGKSEIEEMRGISPELKGDQRRVKSLKLEENSGW
ncbi:MAG: hypothetical protein ACRDAS_11880 [Cetobacterium sp.]